jgi:hypothetical protein
VNENQNARFLYVQRRRIEHDKWCKGCGIKKDPGSAYVMDWIATYAGRFRMAWNQSKCSGCKNYKECGLLVLPKCERYDTYNK